MSKDKPERIHLDNQALQAEYIPHAVLVCYESDVGHYIELHPVTGKNKEGGLKYGAGAPLTRKALRQLLATTEKSKEEAFTSGSRLLPPNILYVDGRLSRKNLMWYEPAQMRSMRFDSTGKRVTLKLPMPAMLFYVEQDKLSVYALATNERPTEATKVYLAPVYNLYADSSVCMGNVKYPKEVSDITAFVEGWSSAFWSSYFTHELGGRQTAKTPLPKLYKQLKGKTTFPIKELKEKGTIRQLIKAS